MKKFLAPLLGLTLLLIACTPTTNENVFNYSKEALEEALLAEQDVFLDFFAEWCPTCHANQAEIEAAIESVGSDDLALFKVNYDDSEEVQNRFGVILQSSYVFIPEGNEEKAILLGPGVFRQPQFEQLLLGQEPSF